MSVIIINNISFTYPSGSEPVFDHLSFSFDSSWKTGIIGRNGKGKTTLFRLLMNEYEYAGEIHSTTSFSLYPFEVPYPELSCMDLTYMMFPDVPYWKVEKEMRSLKADIRIMEQPYETLSSGEKTKWMLSVLFANESVYPLLDEPTNHLDHTGRQILAHYLKKKDGFAIICHDRDFMDQVCDHIIAFTRSHVQIISGNYSAWYKQYSQNIERERATNRQLKKEIAGLMQSADQAGRWSSAVEKTKNGRCSSGLKPDKGFIGHKAEKMMRRRKQLEAHAQRAIEERKSLLRDEEVTETLILHPLPYMHESLAVFDNVVINYEYPLMEPVSFEIHQGDRIAIVGDNGSGKSSLIRLLLKENIPHTGTIHVSDSLKITCVQQNTSNICGSLSDYTASMGIDGTLFRAILRKLDFERELFDRDISSYSLGQKKKTVIAGALCQQSHLYILDEPLNDIDLFSGMQIEELIDQSPGTFIIVEHDQTFLQRIGCREIVLKKPSNLNRK